MDVTPVVQIIEKSKHIGLVFPLHPSYDLLSAADTLVRFLSSRGIYTGTVTPLHPLIAMPQRSFSNIASLNPLTREFIISLDTAHAPVAQLRYEHIGDRVNVILSPSSYAMFQDHITFRQGNIQCDCIIALGVEDIETIDTSSLHLDPLFFSQTPIIAIDIAKKINNYAEINLTDASCTSFSELIYRFLEKQKNYTITHETATLLLSGILHRTRGLNMDTNADTLLVSHELIRAGADFKTARMLAQEHTPLALMPLIGRAMARSKLDTSKETVWSMITSQDFIATDRSTDDIPSVLDHLTREFLHARMCVLLWQAPDTQQIHVCIAADTLLLASLRQQTNNELKNTFIELEHTYDSFLNAEHAIHALLDTVL